MRRRRNPAGISAAADELLQLRGELLEAARKSPDGKRLVGKVMQLARVIQLRAATLEAGKPNPPLLIFGNPPKGARRFGSPVYSVKYRHTGDGSAYVHEFGPKAEMWALADGRILIAGRDGRPMWKEF